MFFSIILTTSSYKNVFVNKRVALRYVACNHVNLRLHHSILKKKKTLTRSKMEKENSPQTVSLSYPPVSDGKELIHILQQCRIGS